MQTILVKILIKLLGNVSVENKSRITTCFLNKLNVYPIKDTISYDMYGTIRINGKELDLEQAIQLKESARVLQNNYFKKLVDNQLSYEAVKMGVHQGLTNDQILFSKAILWYIEQQNLLIEKVAE